MKRSNDNEFLIELFSLIIIITVVQAIYTRPNNPTLQLP